MNITPVCTSEPIIRINLGTKSMSLGTEIVGYRDQMSAMKLTSHGFSMLRINVLNMVYSRDFSD